MTDPLFDGLVPRYVPLHDAVSNVVVRAEHKDRKIVAWTQHELDVVRRDCAEDPDLVARFTARYVNAYAVAKRWRNKLHDRRQAGRAHPLRLARAHRLARAETRPKPAMLARRSVRCARRSRPDGPLKGSQRAAWDRLVAHNALDCVGMRRVCLDASRELGDP